MNAKSVSQQMLAPVADVVALDDRRGLRRTLGDLLPDYLVELGEAEELAVAPQVDVLAQPVAEDVEALVKSVGQPNTTPAYVAVPTIAPSLDLAAQKPRAIVPRVSEPQQVRAIADEPKRDKPAEPAPVLRQTAQQPSHRVEQPEVVPFAERAPSCVSAPTCLAARAQAVEPSALTAAVESPAPRVPKFQVAEVHNGLLIQVTDRLREGDHAGAYQLFRAQVRSGRMVAWSGRSLELYAISALGAGAYREAAISYERLIDAEPEASKWWLGLAASRQAIGLDASELFARAAVLAEPRTLVANR